MLNIMGFSRNTAKYFFLCFFFPILAGWVSLYYYKKKWAKNIFWLFCSFLGLIHIYHPEGMILGEGADSGRYALKFIFMHYNVETFNQLKEIIFSSSKMEFYQPLVTYLVSRYTDNPHWLFFVFAIVYGYFYSRNIWYILDKLPKGFYGYIWILVSYYILICPIWNISGVRMWTALQMFCFGALPYLIDKDRSKLFIAFFSIFVHYTFLMPVTILLVYVFIPDRVKSGKLFFMISFVLYMLTLFMNVFEISQLGDFMYKIIPNLYDSNIKGYLGNEYVERINELANDKSFLYKFVSSIKKYGIAYLIILSFLSIRKNENNELNNIIRLFSYALIMYSIANILSIVPSGSRFIVLAEMFTLPAIIFTKVYLGLRINFCDRIIFFLFIIVIIMQLRIGTECYGVSLFFGNFITATFIESNYSLFRIIYSLF